MKFQSLWADFDKWLAGLGGGEATIYGVLLTGFLASSGWLFRRWWKSKVASHLKEHPDKDHEAIPVVQRNRVDQINNEGPGISVGVANESPITVYNLSVPDDVVRLHAGSTNLPPENAEPITRNFLDDIEKYFRYLPLKGMGDNAGLRLKFPLVELFIPLNARLTLPKGDTLSEELRLAGRRLTDEEGEQIGKRLDEARPVLNLVTEHSVLVILGDPGSGKSTVVRFLAYLLATGQGGPFGLDDYLPLLLPLAAYSEKLEHQPDLSLRRFAVEYFKLRMDLDNLGHLLDSRLNQGKVLILLDGLDEVKNIQQRNTVVERVQAFLCQHIVRGNRVIMTSRIIGYREVRPPEIEGLRECTLLDFDEEEMATFIRRWTVVVERQAHQGGQVSRYEAERESSELLEAIQKNSAIRKLASNPLLLTMLVIQKRQGISLPHHRVVLYEQYIVSLLRDWLLARSLHASPRRLPNDRILRKVLEPLALWLQESEPGKGLVNEEDLLGWLRNYYSGKDDPDQAARTFISDVREHSGLLIDRGGRRFGFMHLTFMEYLAGVSLANHYQHGLSEMVDRISDHAGEAEWRETILLSIGYLGLNQKFDQATTELLVKLLDTPAHKAGSHHEIVAAALADMGEEGVTPEGWCQLRQRLIEQGLGEANIPAPKRVSIGRIMAEIGDPRKEVLEVDAMVFCAVPVGPFFLGSTVADDMALDNETKGCGVYALDYSFAISNYPVTVAQFRQFSDEAGIQPEYPNCLKGPENKPVVYVSWDDAIAFCEWLTKKWRKKGWLPTGWRVDLPSEPEWEKAARGGEAIPVSPRLATISPAMIPTLSTPSKMVANNRPQRRYPWGDEADAERMNFDMNIGEVSTVGCYPGGASPYGCEDMSGNVWEWTRSLYGNYPYPEQPEGRKTRESREERGSRVLRGGSFNYNQSYVRCSVRNYYDPSVRRYDVGFRVVLSP